MLTSVAIISCHRYESRREHLTTVLVPQLLAAGTPYFFVVADPFQSDEFKLTGDLLSVKCGDDYLSLPKKLFMVFKYMRVQWPNHGLIKIDDDWKWPVARIHELSSGNPFVHGHRVVDAPRARRAIGKSVLATYYRKYSDLALSVVGNKLQNSDYLIEYTGPWYDGGSGYYMSPDALATIVDWHHGDVICVRDIYEDKYWIDVLRKAKTNLPAELRGRCRLDKVVKDSSRH